MPILTVQGARCRGKLARMKLHQLKIDFNAEQDRLLKGNTVVIISSISAGENVVDAVQMRVV